MKLLLILALCMPFLAYSAAAKEVPKKVNINHCSFEIHSYVSLEDLQQKVSKFIADNNVVITSIRRQSVYRENGTQHTAYILCNMKEFK